MNYPYPIPGSQSNPASFVADDTHDLGSYDKSDDARTILTIDYSQVTQGVTLTNFFIKVKPGGLPNLTIGQGSMDAAFKKIIFFVSSGISGRTYTVDVTAIFNTDERRTDRLTINVFGDDCGCSPLPPPPPLNGEVSGDGSVIVNDRPRFFVSATIPVGARVLDRWYDTSNGQLYEYISNGITSLWVEAGSGGGSGGSGSAITILSIVPIHPDGVTSVFTLSTVIGRPVTIIGANTLFVSVDGVWQDPATQYTAGNNQIAFTQPPFADSKVFMLWFAPYLATGGP